MISEAGWGAYLSLCLTLCLTPDVLQILVLCLDLLKLLQENSEKFAEKSRTRVQVYLHSDIEKETFRRLCESFEALQICSV